MRIDLSSIGGASSWKVMQAEMQLVSALELGQKICL